jgi:hypothetical protein
MGILAQGRLPPVRTRRLPVPERIAPVASAPAVGSRCVMLIFSHKKAPPARAFTSRIEPRRC